MSESKLLRRQAVACSRRIDGGIRMLCNLIVGVTVMALLAGLAANVAMRYLLQGGGIGWVSELPALLFPWMIAAGIVLAVQRGGHITIDLLASRLSAAGRSALTAGVHLLLVVAYLVLFKVVIDMMEIVAIERSAMLDLPLSWSYAAVAFALLGIAVCSMLIALRAILEGGDGLAIANTEEAAP